MNSEQSKTVGIGFGTLLFTALIATLAVELISYSMKEETTKETYKFPEAKRAFDLTTGSIVRIEPLSKEEKVKMKISNYAFRVRIEFYDAKEGRLRSLDEGEVAIISQYEIVNNRASICSYKFKLPFKTIEQSSHDCVQSVTREANGVYLITEKARTANSIATYMGSK